MSIKILISTLGIALIPLFTIAQNTKFALAVQTTTIESPIPFADFTNYEINTQRGNRKDYSIEVLGRVFLNENVALRLRTGLTTYDFEQNLGFSSTAMAGTLLKYALGIESRRILGLIWHFGWGATFKLVFSKI
jgi:hypothetical protein